MKKINFIILLVFVTFAGFSQEKESYFFEPGSYYILDTHINVRKMPGLNSEKIGQVTLGDKIEVIKTVNESVKIDNYNGYWLKIKKDNLNGYIFSKYVAAKTLKKSDEPEKKVFIRYSTNSHHFYFCDLDKDLLFTDGITVKNIKIDKSYFDSKMADWPPEVFYDKEFNPEIIILTIDNAFVNYGYRLFYVLDTNGNSHYAGKIKIGSQYCEYYEVEMTLKKDNIIEIIDNSAETRQLTSGQYILKFNDGNYSLDKL